MDEEVQLYLEDAQEKMEKALKHLESELVKMRAGKADPHMLDGIMVDYYGNPTPLNQVSNVNTPDARTIAIQPWEKNMIIPIEKAIMASNIGITPANNGEIIRLAIPPLTEERRKELVKKVNAEGESAKVSIRNARRDANDTFKKLQKDGLAEDEEKKAEEKMQKATDQFIEKVDVILKKKENDIMTI